MENIQNEQDLINSFDKSAKEYDDITSTFGHEIGQYLKTKILSMELPSAINKLELLDLGGGTGKFSIILSKMGYNVTLVDISERSLEIAKSNFLKEKLSIKTINASGEKLPIDNDTFDIIVMIGCVISYTPNPEKLLQECKRILKKNGILIFDFSNTFGWANEIHDLKLRLESIESTEKLIQMGNWDYPMRLFNYKFMEKLVLKNNFKIKSKYGCINATTSLPLKIRYSKEFDQNLLERYKIKEFELSKDKECYGTSWECIIVAIK